MFISTNIVKISKELNAGGIAVKTTPVEELFTVLNETATLLQEELNCSYLEALAETGENIFQESVIQEN